MSLADGDETHDHLEKRENIDDCRSRKLVVVAHCLLNQNAKVEGLAGGPGVFESIVSLLVRRGVGIIQLRCPEIVHLGPGRPLGTDTCEQYDTPTYRETCRRLASELAAEIAAYERAGYAVLCVLGVEGSPSCSVARAPRLVGGGERVLKPGRGVFMDVLESELGKAGLDVPMVGIPESDDAGDLEAALKTVENLLANARG
jgi:predicted secreted protein